MVQILQERFLYFRICNVKKHTQSTKSDTCDTGLPKLAPKYNTFDYLASWFMRIFEQKGFHTLSSFSVSSIFLSIYLSVYLSLSIYLSVYLSTYLSIYLSIYLSTYIYIYTYIYIIYIYKYIYIYIYVSMYMINKGLKGRSVIKHTIKI